MFRRDRQIIQPSPVTFVTGHDASDNPTVKDANQKQIRSHFQFAPDVFVRVIPWPNQITTPPKRNYRFLVVRLKCSNLHEAA
jgi:hypothetical protein